MAARLAASLFGAVLGVANLVGSHGPGGAARGVRRRAEEAAGALVLRWIHGDAGALPPA